jgi:hypothetical protein
MSDVMEMWNSPWRTLQKHLARGFEFEESAQNPWGCDSPHPGGSQFPGRAAHSWLVRARSRELRLASIIQ